MSELNKIMTVRAGKQASAVSFPIGTVPGTLPFLDDLVDAQLLPRGTERIERDTYREDNEDATSVVGVKELDDIGLTLLARGVSGNAGGALARLTDTPYGHLFDSIMGTGTDKAEVATAITGDTGASGIITVTTGTGHVDGGGVLFMDGNGDYVAREIVSGGGTGTLTLDRDHQDGAPGSDNIPYGSVHWSPLGLTSMHTPLYIRAEGANWCRDYGGCYGDLTIEIDDKGCARFAMKWMPTDWRDTAEPNTAFSAPSAGNFVMGMGSRLWVDETESYMMKGGTLRLGYTIEPRGTSFGVNGVHGYIVRKKQPVFEATLYVGTNGAMITNSTGFGEVEDSNATALLCFSKIAGLVTKADGSVALPAGSPAETHDIGIQIGARPKGTIYARMPAAELSGRFDVDNGVEVIKLMARARRPSSGAALRLHCF